MYDDYYSIDPVAQSMMQALQPYFGRVEIHFKEGYGYLAVQLGKPLIPENVVMAIHENGGMVNV